MTDRASGAALLVFTLHRGSAAVAVVGPALDAAAFLLVILLTTPLQAAAEEVIFRGYLLQACAACRTGRGSAWCCRHWCSPGCMAARIAAHAVSNALTYGIGVLTISATAVRGTCSSADQRC